MKYSIILLLLISASTLAQRGERSEKIKAYKLAHITDALDLSTDEAAKFWPIYNAHEDIMQSLRKQRRNDFGMRKANFESLTEAQAEKILANGLKFKEEELIASKNFIKNLKGVIPATKMVKLHHAEETFKKMLLKRMRGGKDRNKN